MQAGRQAGGCAGRQAARRTQRTGGGGALSGIGAAEVGGFGSLFEAAPTPAPTPTSMPSSPEAAPASVFTDSCMVAVGYSQEVTPLAAQK